MTSRKNQLAWLAILLVTNLVALEVRSSPTPYAAIGRVEGPAATASGEIAANLAVSASVIRGLVDSDPLGGSPVMSRTYLSSSERTWLFLRSASIAIASQLY